MIIIIAIIIIIITIIIKSNGEYLNITCYGVTLLTTQPIQKP
jgi:hypothetical protein